MYNIKILKQMLAWALFLVLKYLMLKFAMLVQKSGLPRHILVVRNLGKKQEKNVKM